MDNRFQIVISLSCLMHDLLNSFKSAAKGCSSVIFDYDSTIARVPIDWIVARSTCHQYLESILPGVDLPEELRVDEMEARALAYAPEEADRIFQHRHYLESGLDGSHEPVQKTIALIKFLASTGQYQLYIVSNNLHRTVEHGLLQLNIALMFDVVLGIDDVGVPKPDTKAFHLLAETANLAVEDSIFIGDSDQTDGVFCSNLGMTYLNINRLD